MPGSAGEGDASAGDGSGELGGSAATSGTGSGGAAGTASGGDDTGGQAIGGKAGSTSGGESGGAGKGSAGTAGKGAGGMAGVGGTSNPEPMPVTVETREIEDANIVSCRAAENFGSQKSLTVDASGSGSGTCAYQALLDARSLAMLPPGAKVGAATLTLTCANDGDSLVVSYVEEAWQQGTVRWLQRPGIGAKLGTVTCAAAGPVEVELTAAVAAWHAGEHARHGIYLTTEGTNGTDFATSEAEDAARRPVLRVTYTLGK